MVAISLYRGNLHRVPDVPRRWLMPTPKISLKNFKSLLTRRSLALSRHRSSSSAAATTSSNPNPNSATDQLIEAVKAGALPKFEEPLAKSVSDCQAGTSGEAGKEQRRPDGDDSAAEKGGDVSDLALAVIPDEKVWEDSVVAAVEVEKVDQLENPNSEMKDDLSDEKRKRKREVEEKLEVLNQKKHNLVQVLKQILNAEEELKRRSSVQGIVVRPSVSLQVDVTNDSGSMSRQVTPRLGGSDANGSGDMEGVEGDELSNHNFHPRHMHRMNSMSPSSESPLRRPAFGQHSAVPHPSRASLAATGSSPSRFAPTGHQGLPPANLPTISASGTNFVASSPSPAASGGTSTFRDARLPSPWN